MTGIDKKELTNLELVPITKAHHECNDNAMVELSDSEDRACCLWRYRSHGKFKLKADPRSMCLQCKVRKTRSSFCSQTCILSAGATSTTGRLLEIPTTHSRFAAIRSHFYESWKEKHMEVFVQHMYKIVYPESKYQLYVDYRSSIESREGFRYVCRKSGNVVLNWHGTYRDCDLGDNGATTLCTNKKCFLCGVISNSYSMANARAGSYGKGIYTSPSSSTAHAYGRNQRSSPTWCLLLNRVVAGSSKRLFQYGERPLPEGCHSFRVDIERYDQLIVHRDEAIRPAYLIVYGPLPKRSSWECKGPEGNDTTKADHTEY